MVPTDQLIVKYNSFDILFWAILKCLPVNTYILMIIVDLFFLIFKKLKTLSLSHLDSHVTHVGSDMAVDNGHGLMDWWGTSFIPFTKHQTLIIPTYFSQIHGDLYMFDSRFC